MSEQIIQCPICSQEFPLYDQRGFRNAGFTAHRKWCTDRKQQQQNDGVSQDLQSSRASRFAMAIRRRLLPATQAPTPPIEASSSILVPILPGSSTTSVSSDPSISSRKEPSTPPYDKSISTVHPQSSFVQHPRYQQPQQQHRRQPLLRQRHTWNHWNTCRDMPRRTSVNAMVMSSEIAPSTSAPTPPTAWSLQIGDSPRAMDPEAHAPPTYSLLKTSANSDTPNAPWIAHQPTLPLLSGPPPATSSSVCISDGPFSFASMATTLPWAYSRNEVDSSISAGYVEPSGNQSTPMFAQAGEYASNDLASGYLSSIPNAPIQYHQQLDYYNQQQNDNDYHYRDMIRFVPNNLAMSPASNNLFQQQQRQYRNTVSELDPYTATTFMDSPIVSSSTSSPNPYQPPDLVCYPPNVEYCGYCQTHDGLHDPSCNLIQFFLTNMMDDNNENTFSTI